MGCPLSLFDKTSSEKPLRERVEVYATKDGKVVAGLYPDGAVAAPGGGIDPGESPEQAGAREYKEEVGLKVKNLRPLPVEPLVELWRNKRNLTDKEKERRAEFSGSRTTFLLGEVAGSKETPEDPGNIKRLIPRKVDSLISKQQDVVSSSPKSEKERAAARLEALDAVREQLNKSAGMFSTISNRVERTGIGLADSIRHEAELWRKVKRY